MVDAGFEPGTAAAAVWSATNEPPHLHRMVMLVWIRVLNTDPDPYADLDPELCHEVYFYKLLINRWVSTSLLGIFRIFAMKKS